MLPTQQRPLRVAVVGAGPAGFYTAYTLFKQGIPVKVDVFEKLPTPFGLVRYGVAPDHQRIKKIIKVFEQTASDKRFSYFGNVTVGRDVSVFELKEFYDATVFCYGTEVDRHLGIKGENLKGSFTSSQFIGWYNGHPQFRDCEFDFSNEVAVIMGQGNVAIDIARILCSNRAELVYTDICQHALNALLESKIKEVHVYGRRSAVHAAFTPMQIKEMARLTDCCPMVDPRDLEGPADVDHRKNLEILRSFTTLTCGSRKKKFFLHFNRTPIEIIGQSQVEKVRFEINQKGKPTGQYEEINCGAFFTSIGHAGESIEGVPFLPQKGIVPNRQGRILDGEKTVKGWYASGWVAHGARGLIGTNKLSAQETVHSLMEDLHDLPVCDKSDTEKLIELLRGRGVIPMTFIDWKKIDAYEIMMGLKLGKPREKLTKVLQMMFVLRKKH